MANKYMVNVYILTGGDTELNGNEQSATVDIAELIASAIVAEDVAGQIADAIEDADKTADNQAASTAVDVAGLKTDFNALLTKLKSAGLMAADA